MSVVTAFYTAELEVTFMDADVETTEVHHFNGTSYGVLAMKILAKAKFLMVLKGKSHSISIACWSQRQIEGSQSWSTAVQRKSLGTYTFTCDKGVPVEALQLILTDLTNKT